MVIAFSSCATSLSTKIMKYDVISANALGFNKNNKVTGYDAVIRIGKLKYNAKLNGKLEIEEVNKLIEK